MKKFLILILIVITGCSGMHMLVDQELADRSTPMLVKGRQGWVFNQVLSFGPYSTDKVKRGWTKSYDLPFVLNFQGAREKFSFRIFNETNHSAEVFCIGKFNSIELQNVSKYFDLVISEKNHFAGTIFLGADTDSWEFLLHNPDGEAFRPTLAGFLRQGQRVIEVTGVDTYDDLDKPMLTNFLGYEFIENGKVLSAVETLNNGAVWIPEAIEPELRLVLAGLASALLLRTSLQEEVDEI